MVKVAQTGEGIPEKTQQEPRSVKKRSGAAIGKHRNLSSDADTVREEEPGGRVELVAIGKVIELQSSTKRNGNATLYDNGACVPVNS